MLGGVKNFSMGICNGAPSTARSSYFFNDSIVCSLFLKNENVKICIRVAESYRRDKVIELDSRFTYQTRPWPFMDQLIRGCELTRSIDKVRLTSKPPYFSSAR